MSDQQAPATEQDTPAVAGPDQAPGTAQEQAEVDWQKRYADLHPEYTRTSQEAAQLREAVQQYERALTSDDPDIQREALEALGYQIPDEVEDLEPAEYEDPYDELRNEITSVREQLNQREQAEQQAEQAALIREVTDERLAQYEGLSEQDQDMILAYAINVLPPVNEPGVPVPLPDVKGAVEHFQQWEGERQKQWAKTKRAPYVSPGGHPANEVPDPGHGQQARLNRAMLSLRNSVGDNE